MMLCDNFLNHFLSNLYIARYTEPHSEYLHLAGDIIEIYISCKNQVNEI